MLTKKRKKGRIKTIGKIKEATSRINKNGNKTRKRRRKTKSRLNK